MTNEGTFLELDFLHKEQIVVNSLAFQAACAWIADRTGEDIMQVAANLVEITNEQIDELTTEQIEATIQTIEQAMRGLNSEEENG